MRTSLSFFFVISISTSQAGKWTTQAPPWGTMLINTLRDEHIAIVCENSVLNRHDFVPLGLLWTHGINKNLSASPWARKHPNRFRIKTH